MGAAIDRYEEEYLVTVQANKTSSSSGGNGENGGQQGIFISSGQGKSVFDAARNVTFGLHLRNYWPHTQAVIIGEELARDSILSVVDFFTRDPKRRLSVYFLVGEGLGKDILKNQPENAELSSMEIVELIELTRAHGFGVDANLRGFIREMEGISGASVLNKVKSVTVDMNKGETNQDGGQKTSTLDGVAVFYKYKLLGYLSPQETRSINFLKDSVGSWVIVTNFTGGTEGEITSELTKSEISFTPSITDGLYTMKAKLSLSGKIVEYIGEKPLSTIDIKKIEDKFASDIKKDIEETFLKVQKEYQVDIFNIGKTFSKKYPFVLDFDPEQWNKIFAENMQLDLEVEFKINYSETRINRVGSLEG
jgi:spore germination protein KC